MTVRRLLRSLLCVSLLCAAIMAQDAPQIIQGEQLEQFLMQSKITSLKNLGQGVTIPRKATMELNGLTHFGVFKTIDVKKSGATQLDRGAVEVEFQDSWRTEIAAYEVDKIIGLGMVPATVGRVFNGERASIQFWVDSIMPEAERVKKKVKPPDVPRWNQTMAKARVFDALIYNTDRHLNNLLVTKNFGIILIDHSRSFRPFNELRNKKDLTRFSRSLLAGLANLNEAVLKERVGDYLTTFQIQGLLKRRDLIIALAQQLVQQKGESLVLY